MSRALSDRVNNIKPSPTLAVTAKANQLKAEGKKIISLGAGEPDFDTPQHIKQAAIDAIHVGKTKYTAVGGTNSLKQAICNKLARDNQLNYNPDQILVSCGAKQSIYNACQAILNPGDEVIIPAPYWVSYPDITILTDAKPIVIETSIEEKFKLSPEKLASSINNNTKLVFLNSPSNPTGVCYTKSELQALAEVLIKHPEVYIISDDIYELIHWGNEPFANIVMACPELYSRTIVINGVSKAFAMTGWRIGYAAGEQALIKAMNKIQGQSTSNPCSISQAAAEVALNVGNDCVTEMVEQFKQRHDFVVQRLNSIPGISCIATDGAFYAFFHVAKLIASSSLIKDDSELAKKLIEDAGIALVPGTAFGSPGYLRLSYATSMEQLEVALNQLSNFVSKLQTYNT